MSWNGRWVKMFNLLESDRSKRNGAYIKRGKIYLDSPSEKHKFKALIR